MALVIHKRLWVYLERLYITAHDKVKFKELLKRHEIEYNNPLYTDFNNTISLYTFMSVEDYSFADFMQTVPSYKYIDLISEIIFDSKVRATRTDNWNYYGEKIKKWIPIVVDLLQLNNIAIDWHLKKLVCKKEDEIELKADFLPYCLSDPFLDYIRKEINETFKNGDYLSVMLLSRKLLESMLIRIFEVVFPKISSGKYKPRNHSLWFNKDRNQYHNFETLIDNLKSKAKIFKEDKDLILEICSIIKPFKDETNRYVHNDFKIPDLTYISSWKISRIINLVRKVYKKYCNP